MPEKNQGYDQIKGGETFDRVRGAVWGTPGFERRQSTVIATMPIVGATATHVVETIRTENGLLVFIQAILPEGTYRIVLPTKVVEAIARQRESIVSQRHKRAARTRKEMGIVPFQKKKAE